MKTLKTLLSVLALVASYTLQAQVAINTDGSNADNSAMLDVKSTQKGLLIPRMTQAQIEAISSPANGLQVFNTDDDKLYIYILANNQWKEVEYGAGVINPCGTPITDYDGNTYNTVLIGTQCWMKENLKTTHYKNGTSIPNETNGTAWGNLTSSAYVWYSNDVGYKDTYGALYNWYATDDANGLCPTGWHVPTDDEWTALTNYIGGISSPHGNELKSCRQVNSPSGGDCNTTTHPRWNENATHYGTDNYGFSGLPGGGRDGSGTFYNMGNAGYWWSSTESSANAWFRYLNYNDGNVGVNNNIKKTGRSVRCLRD